MTAVIDDATKELYEDRLDEFEAEKIALQARRQAAATKRHRTRQALLRAARQLFGSRGWQATRIEDVATAAGVSVATAYNHFSSKESLLGYCYEPVLDDILTAGTHAVLHHHEVRSIAKHYASSVVEKLHRERGLTVALLTSLSEAGSDDHNARVIARLPESLSTVLLVTHKYADAEDQHLAYEVAAYHMYGLLMYMRMHPDKSEIATRQFFQDQLLAVIS